MFPTRETQVAGSATSITIQVAAWNRSVEDCKVRVRKGRECWVPRGRYSDPRRHALFAHGSEYRPRGTQ